MREKFKSYTIPLLVLFVEALISLYFIGTHRIPDASVVQEWPSGLSTRAVPLWVATIVVPALNLFTIAAMELNILFPGPKKWRSEAWRLRGASGPVTDAFFLVALLFHYVGLLNVSSQWTLNQGMIQTAAGVAMGILMLVVGNYQTKTSNIGMWALTPWKVTGLAARQKCQQIASQVAMLGGLLIVGLSVVLAGSPPLPIGAAPVYPVIPLMIGLYALIYIVVAVWTWGISRQENPETVICEAAGE